MFNRLMNSMLRPGTFERIDALWLRLLGLIYIAAFASFWPQVTALIGSKGISPASQFLAAMHTGMGAKAYWEVPSVFWLSVSDKALVIVCIAGCIAGLLLAAGFFSRLAAALCFVLYLSIAVVGQPFTNFQWDALLLESGFLAIFAGSPLLAWGYRVLLFRLMFESGLVKLTSHDPNWRNLHALRFHFLTQPLPTPLAYYLYRAPAWLLDSLNAITLLFELFVPFLLFGTRRMRKLAVVLLVLLQVVILLTGNYAFFNFLTIALCVWGLDDSLLQRLPTWFSSLHPRVTFRNRIAILGTSIPLVFLMAVGLLGAVGIGLNTQSQLLLEASASIAPFEIVNTYGLFAVMTTTRPEIVIEGSQDGINWKEYQFPYKPGNVRRHLPIVAPYQPRLDWQMWFAALGSYDDNRWFGVLLFRLLTGEPAVKHLLSSEPFNTPPRYLRALLYDYQFTTPAERRQTGDVWKRKLQGTWFGPVSLRKN